MVTTVEVLDDASVVLLILEPGGRLLQDIVGRVDEIAALLAEQPEPVFLVLDFSGVMMRLDEVSWLMARLARGQDALLRHRKVRETAIVTTSEVMIAALAIVNGGLFDGVHITTWATRDAALAHCQDQK